ncbi:MAG: FHA domain-containing protein [Candidatus Symbiothrix sp.]|jgi:cbb3-type cytochrome oxidase subunit 3|nr:FHA domain-containing protein [Candidatus Symbiothrix sp.]
MKRTFLSFVCLISLCASLQARGGIKQPAVFVNDTVSFTWHEDNPEQKQKADFVLKDESDKPVNFDFACQSPNVADVEKQKTILFLWEDMAQHGTGQFNFTKNALSGFFNEVSISADKFAVAAFNRRKNEPLSLKQLTGGFVSDKSQILSAIQQYKRSTETYREFPNRSDMYTAIREGLELLQSGEENVKAIVVFTAGYSMKNSGSDSEPQVLLKAQNVHIPVYVIEYITKSGLASEPENFAKSTYGLFQYYTAADQAKNGLKDIYATMTKRYLGQDYKINFPFKAKPDGKTHSFGLTVSGVSQDPVSITAPAFSLWVWIQDNPVLAIGIGVLILLLIMLAIIWIIKSRKKREAAQQSEIERIEKEQQAVAAAARDEAAKNKQDLLAYQQGEERKKQEAQEQAEAERLTLQMQTKNLYPRLQCKVGNETFSHNVNAITTTIGRKEDNDLILSNGTVSSHHAKITFTGSGFEIFDMKSTNKVIVNGQFVEHATLKNADIIGLGETVITFYL